MTQAQILKILKQDEWTLINKIRDKLGLTDQTLNRSLKSMYKYGEVLRKLVKEGNVYKYAYKLR